MSVTIDACKRLFRDCRIEDMSNREYHGQGWRSMSKTRLSVFAHDPYAYFCKYVSKEIPDRDTDALLFGRVLHAVVLECQGLVNDTNYQENTLAVFRPHTVPSRSADFTDDDEGEIWIESFPEPGIVRRSKLWGGLNAGEWHMLPASGKEVAVGFCAFADMHPNGVEFRAIPDEALSDRGARQGKQWTAFVGKHSGDVLMRFQTPPGSNERGWCDVLQMRRRLRKHADVNYCIFQGGQSEVSIVGKCAETGIEVRTRLDFIKPVDGGVIVTDLKTTLNTEDHAWARQADQNRLFMQASWQLGMAAHVFPGELEYRFVVIDKTAPFSPSSFDVEDKYLEIGCEEYQTHIREFKACCDGDRPWEKKGFGEKKTLLVPEWRIRKELKDELDAQLAFN